MEKGLSIIFRIYGLTKIELKVEVDRVANDLGMIEDQDFGCLFSANQYGIDLKIWSLRTGAEDQMALINFKESLRDKLEEYLYGEGEQTMEAVVGQLLRVHHHTLAVAESCSGGLIADRITDVAGSSDYFLQGLVVYSNQAKKVLLGVSEETLANFGAVSHQVVQEMCLGLKESSSADLTLAVSGIAGPGGGTIHKPVGLVYVCLYDGLVFQVKEGQFQGCRRDIKIQSSQMALDLVRRYFL